MKPYTDEFQKTMLPVHGKPLLNYILEGLIFAGFKEFIIVVGYKKEQIIDYFKNGKKWNIDIEYVEQKQLNGTGGALKECQNWINEEHLLLSWGDILVPYSVYKELIHTFHKESQDFVLVANFTNDPYKGAAVYVENDYCIDIIEKPSKRKSKTNLNNCGIFILANEVFKVLDTLKPSSRGEIELTQALRVGIINKNWQIRVIQMNEDQFRGDFGNKATYERLSQETSWLSKLKKI
jgi:dTDP-glucose pyrophosphorylase